MNSTKRNNSKASAIQNQIGVSLRLQITGILILTILISVVLLTLFNTSSVKSTTTITAAESMGNLGKIIISNATEPVQRSAANLEVLALSPVIIDAVKSGNLVNASLTEEDIINYDNAWKDSDPNMEARITSILDNPVSDYLRAFTKKFPEEVEVFATDLRGLNVAMTDRTSDYLQGDEGWWKSAYYAGQGQTFIDAIEYDDSTKIYAMNIGVPVRDETGALIGILRGTVNISVIFNSLSEVRLGETGDVILLDQSGNILFTRTPDMIMQPAPDWMAQFASGSQDWSETLTDLEGNPSLLVHSKLGGILGDTLGWELILNQDLREIQQQNQKNLLTNIIISMVVALVLSLLGYLLIGPTINALKTLTTAANVIAGGDLRWTLDENGKKIIFNRQDEIGQIGRALDATVNYMLEKIVWFEALLDAIPLPISVTDLNMNWTFINKPVENFLGVTRKDVLGHQCNEWNADICKTENCGTSRLRKNFTQTFFNQMGGNFKVDTSFILNSSGERVGHIEVVQEITQ